MRQSSPELRMLASLVVANSWSVKSSNQLYETWRKCQAKDSSMPCVYCHAIVNGLELCEAVLWLD